MEWNTYMCAHRQPNSVPWRHRVQSVNYQEGDGWRGLAGSISISDQSEPEVSARSQGKTQHTPATSNSNCRTCQTPRVRSIPQNKRPSGPGGAGQLAWGLVLTSAQQA